MAERELNEKGVVSLSAMIHRDETLESLRLKIAGKMTFDEFGVI